MPLLDGIKSEDSFEADQAEKSSDVSHIKKNGNRVSESLNSENVELENGNALSKPPSKRCMNYYDGNIEARALAINQVAQGLFIIGGVFISTAILRLAIKVGGCNTGGSCKIIGLKASSLLTTITSISGFICSFLMPVVGAIVDHSDYRQQVSLYSGVLLIILNFVQVFVSEKTFELIIFSYSLSGVIFLLHQVTTFAYFNELTSEEKTLTRYLASFHGIRQLTMLILIVVVVIISNLLPGFDKGSLEFILISATIAQAIIVIVGTISLFFTFYKGLKTRSALSQIPEHQNIFTAGFKKLGKTMIRIYRNLPAVKWFLISTAFVGSVLGSLVSLAITYCTFFLKYGSTEIAIATMIYLLSSVPGAVALPYFVLKFGILKNMIFILFMFMTLWAIVGLVVPSEEYGNVFYLICFIWGFLAGMIIPNGRLLFLQLIPKGQESEMMGLYIFFTYGFVWAPPLVLTFMNEIGISLRYSISFVSLFILCSLLAVCMIGNVEDAKEKARQYAHDARPIEA